MSENEQREEFSFKNNFVPLTTLKAIHWIFIIGLIVFLNVLFNGLVGDDNGQIVSNSLVHSLSNIPFFFTSSTFNLGNGISGFYFKPLLLTVFTLIYSIFGQTPFFFHLFQIFLYMTNSILVFLFLKRFLNKEIAFFLSIIFLVHPMNEEVAAYISDYQDLLFFFFGMMALLFSSANKSKYIHLKVFVMLALSLLSKETGIIFCFINLLYIFLFRKERMKTTLLYTCLLIVPYAIIRTHAVGFNTPHDFRIGRVSLSARIINIPKMIVFYLQTFILPINLAVSYDWIVSRLNFSGFYLPLLIISTFLSAVFFTGKTILKRNTHQFYLFLFFALWFLFGLGIHLQFIPLDGTVATRWFYLPMVGLLGMIGVWYQNYIKNKKVEMGFFIFSLILLVLFSLLTIIRNVDFKDNLTLMCHDANVSHDDFSLENSCGVSLLAVGTLDQAQIHLERSVALAPYFGTNYWGLGAVLGRKAELQKNKDFYNKSVIAFQTAIRIEPSIPWSYESLGYLYAHYADSQTAKQFLGNALKKFPNDSTLWLHYAYAEYKVGNKRTALEAITNAYTLNPNDTVVAQFYYSLSHNLPIKVEQITFK